MPSPPQPPLPWQSCYYGMKVDMLAQPPLPAACTWLLCFCWCSRCVMHCLNLRALVQHCLLTEHYCSCTAATTEISSLCLHLFVFRRSCSPDWGPGACSAHYISTALLLLHRHSSIGIAALLQHSCSAAIAWLQLHTWGRYWCSTAASSFATLHTSGACVYTCVSVELPGVMLACAIN